MTDEERDGLIDTIIVKTQGFINGNIREGDKHPVKIFKRLLAQYAGSTARRCAKICATSSRP